MAPLAIGALIMKVSILAAAAFLAATGLANAQDLTAGEQ
jgi:hypothetical protein